VNNISIDNSGIVQFDPCKVVLNRGKSLQSYVNIAQSFIEFP
jgi:hypothetical protein